MTVTHQDEATALVQDCWQRIRERRFQFQQSQLRLSISAGVTQLRPDDRAIDDAIKRSDDSYIYPNVGDEIPLPSMVNHWRQWITRR